MPTLLLILEMLVAYHECAYPSGVTTYTYDNLDRLKSKATPIGTLSYTYDDQGNLLTTDSSNASGVDVTYEYDTLNRLKKATDNNLAAGSNTTNYTYDGVGNLASMAYPNTVTHAYVHNNLNRLTDLSVTGPPGTLASYAYTLGPTGNRTQVNENGGRQARYSYDNLYRLTIETVLQDPAGVNGTVGYAYDLTGNRTRRQSTVSNVPTSAHLYDTRDRMDTLTGYGYDANGNTTASPNPGGGANTDTYDFEDRLVGRTRIGTTIAIAYDGDGNRVSKTVNGVTTKYLVDANNLTGYAQVVEELNSSNQVTRRYTYGSDLISQTQVASSTTHYYGYDGHGSVRHLTNASGAVTDTYNYDAFGVPLATTGATPNLYLYAGEQWDPDLGMYYNRARYLNVQTGRLWTFDSYEGNKTDPASLHKYLYGAANPVLCTDPSGHMNIVEVGAALSIGAGLFAILSAGIHAKLEDVHERLDMLGQASAITGIGPGLDRQLEQDLFRANNPQTRDMKLAFWKQFGEQNVMVQYQSAAFEDRLLHAADGLGHATEVASAGLTGMAYAPAGLAPRVIYWGKPHGGSMHWMTMLNVTWKESGNCDVAAVYTNRAISTITGREFMSQLRPDVGVVLNSGKLRLYEVVVSQSQTSAIAKAKLYRTLLGEKLDDIILMNENGVRIY